jgi:hypothetical protein
MLHILINIINLGMDPTIIIKMKVFNTFGKFKRQDCYPDMVKVVEKYTFEVGLKPLNTVYQ